MVSNPRSDAWQYFDNIVEEGVAVCKLCKQRMKNDRSWGLKQHLQKLHNAKVEVWNYFDSIMGEGMSVCKRCKKSIRNNRSINLIQHLEVEHNIVLVKIEEGKRRRKRAAQTDKRDLRPRVEYEVVNLTDNDTNEEIPVQANHENIKQNIMGTTLPVQLDHEHARSSFEHAGSSVQIQTIEPAQIHEYVGQSVKNSSPNQTRNNIVIQSVGSIMPPQTIQEYLRQSVQPIIPVVNTIDVETSNNTPVETCNENSYLNVSKRTTPVINMDQPKRAKTLLAIEMDKKTLMSAVWGLIIDDGVTPQLFGSKNMQALIQPICESISDKEDREFKIDEAECEKLLCSVACHLRNEFSHDLDWRLLSLKVDMDLNGPANTFCVSTQYVHDGKIQSYILGVIDLMDDPQLTEQHVTQVLHKFNIDSNQIIRICWDNTKPKFNTEVKNSEYLNEIKNFEKYPDIKFGDIMVERYIGFIAQLCLLDIFKNPNIFELFLECRNLVKFIGDNSNGFIEIFQTNNLNFPQLDSPWKWGSTYEMMNNLLEARSFLNEKKFPKLEHPEDQFNVNDNLWLFVEAFCESLSFMQKSILKYYNEEIHFGDFYAQWLKSKLLTAKLATSANVKNSHTTTISVDLLKSIETRSKDILGRDCFEACIYLDPRFHHTLGAPEKTKALEYLKKLWSHSNIYKTDVINADSDSPEQAVEPQKCVDDEDAFLNEFLSQDVRETDTRTADVYKKIEELKLPFKSVDTNVLMFWNQQKTIQPEMYALSAICFAFPTTQNYNRNRYSHIYKSQPITKLGSFTRDNLVSIRLNSHLLEGNLEQFGIFHEEKSSDDEL